MISIQRKSLLRVSSAYRTVSAEAVQLIAGFPPIDLMLAERCFLFTRWQERWTREHGKADWTKRLISKIEAWLESTHKRTGYFFTQFLTGHGSFGTYTKRIRKIPDDKCIECKVPDSPEHTYQACKRWNTEREEVRKELGTLPPIEEIITRMLETPESWNILYSYIAGIMRRKERG
ncbi:uncharacterized protein LOC123686563 [Harmonia axyridis]|uniref:uncharacterized protein LOC123686563 n=1 Tax=Harmonia axyridis TaxID=115357 RepID=UPI001E2796F2|nr:uncharacterized protein LOC123686563 [Harmonia axyridis]